MGDIHTAGHPANAGLKLGQQGSALIRRWETLRTRAYLDTEGIPTIGYGTTSATGIPVKMGMVITPAQAEHYLQTAVDKIYGAAVKRLVKVPLRQPEYDALCSFTYNVGAGALQKSTLLRKLNRGDYNAVPGELMKWTNSKSGNAKRGLTNRRRSESELWEQSGRAPLHLLADDEHYPDSDNAPPPPDRRPENRPLPPSGDKAVYQSTTVQAIGSMFAGAGAIVYEKFDQVTEWLRSGSLTDYLLVGAVVAGALWVAYARLYRDQEALRS